MKIRGLAALAVVLVTGACGKVGNPLPPIVRTPERIQDLAVAQSGYRVVLSWTNPARYIDGNPIDDSSVIRVMRGGAEAARVPDAGAGKPQSWDMDAAGEVGATLRFEVQVEPRRGRASALSNTVVIRPVDVPGAPESLVAEVDQYTITLDWKPPVRESAPAGQYIIQRADRPAPWTVNLPPFRDTEFEPGKTYSYAVISALVGPPVIPGAGASTITVVATDRKGPATPAGLEIRRMGTGVLLTWTENTEKDFSRYRVFRSDRDEPLTVTAAAAYFDANYSPGLSYQLQAEDIFENLSLKSAPQSGR